MKPAFNKYLHIVAKAILAVMAAIICSCSENNIENNNSAATSSVDIHELPDTAGFSQFSPASDTAGKGTDPVITRNLGKSALKKPDLAEHDSDVSFSDFRFEGEKNGYKYFTHHIISDAPEKADHDYTEEIISARRAFESGYPYEYYSNNKIANPVPEKIIIKARIIHQSSKNKEIKVRLFLVTRTGGPVQEVIAGSDGVCGPVYGRRKSPHDMEFRIEELF